MVQRELTARCCIAGGGPAGMMLGFLLARAGLEVVVLEKHADFLRDFRGDTIHPSTLELMYELGLLDEFLRLPHQEVRQIEAQIGDERLHFADFTRLPTHCRFLALMPQWDFLNFLAEKGRRYPGFTLLMRTEATDLIEEAERIVGLRAITAEGPLAIRASLVIGADGRHSTIRARAGFRPIEVGAPMDVLWLRVSRLSSDPEPPLGRFDAGRIFISLNRGDHWQCAYVIPKGSFDQLRARGIEAFCADVARLAPFAAGRAQELKDWDDVKLLTVAVDRLPRWYREGLLCIGDAAHAMSPIGGVGVNLAVQDAVAAANLLAGPLAADSVGIADLRRVQRRRALPMRLTQAMQVFVQNRVIHRVLDDSHTLSVPALQRFVTQIPLFRRLAARLIGLGVRPEHIRVPS